MAGFSAPHGILFSPLTPNATSLSLSILKTLSPWLHRQCQEPPCSLPHASHHLVLAKIPLASKALRLCVFLWLYCKGYNVDPCLLRYNEVLKWKLIMLQFCDLSLGPELA